MQSAQFYAQKSSCREIKPLVQTGSADRSFAHGSRERRPVRSDAGHPSGGGSTAIDRGGTGAEPAPWGRRSGRCRASRTASAASRRVLHARGDRAATSVAFGCRRRRAGNWPSRGRIAGERSLQRGGCAQGGTVTGAAPEAQAASRSNARGRGKPARSSSRGAVTGSRGALGHPHGRVWRPFALRAQRGISAQ